MVLVPCLGRLLLLAVVALGVGSALSVLIASPAGAHPQR